MGKRFYKVNIEISNVCNLQCSFCPEVIRPKGLMSVDLFRQIIAEVAPYTRLVTLHLMGEPLLHPELGEFLDICHEHQVRVFLVTNGVLLKEEKFATLLHPSIRQVNFSLHSFRDNFPDRDLNAYLAPIFRFTYEAFAKRPSLFINYRLWNLADPKGQAPQNHEVLEAIETYFQIPLRTQIENRQKKNVPVKRHLSLHFDTEFIWPALDLPLLGTEGTCQGLTSHFGILVDGTVVPCCLDKEGVIALGKLPAQPLSEILNSPRVKQLLAGFREGKLIEALCQRCQYIERFQPAHS